MAIVELNKKNLKALGIKSLNDKLPMLGCPIEEETKTSILVDISPNRPDLLSEQGLIRALQTFTGKKKDLKAYKAEKSSYAVKIEKSVKDVRPFTACAVVKNLKFDDEKIKEIIDIQEKLHATYGRYRKKVAIGIYPFEKIKMPITYKAMAPKEIKFQPLESEREMTALQILQQTPAGREYAHLLEGKKKFPIFADAMGSIMSMPPIINSQTTGKITEKTKDVFIECSGFDFNTLSKCLNIIVCVLADMGGKIYSIKLEGIQKTTPELEPEKMKIKLENVNKLLGLNLKEAEIKELLKKMGFSYKNENVGIPCYRADILHEVDLIEDIAIAYGYGNFKEEIPQISTIGKEDGFEIFKGKVSEILIGLGFLETCSYNLTNEEDENKKMNTDEELIKIPNAKTNYNVLRQSMLPSLIKILSENKDREYPQQIFEIGTIFLNKDKEEKEKLALVLSHGKANFTQVKQILDYFLSSIGIQYKIKKTKYDSFIEGRTGHILVKGQEVGIIGEVHPAILENWKLTTPVTAFELDLTKIYKN